MTKSRSNATAPNAKGTLVVGNGTDASTTLAVASTAGYVLTVDSAEATGLKWAGISSGLTYTNIATSATSPIPDITNGNATIIHRYAQSGKFVHQFLQFTWGSTTTISSGASLLTLSPAVTAASGYSIFSVGTALFYDSSANQVFLGRLRMDGQAIYLYAEDDLGSYLRTVNTTNTVPMTWATGDVITVNAFYEAA